MTTPAETEQTAVHARPRARWRVLLAELLVGALVASAGAALVVRENRHLAERDAIGAAAVRTASAIRDVAQAVAAGRAALEASSGRVDDERVRTHLTAALAAARAAAHVGAASLEELGAAADRLAATHDDLVSATDEVTSAVAAWELAQARAAWSRAGTRLDAAMSAARGVLDSSAGRVADDAVRQALATALDAAQTLRAVPAPTDAPALTTATTALAGAADSLAVPQAAVTAAVDSWEKAQAAAAAALPTEKRATRAKASAPAAKPSSGSGAASDPSGGLTWVPNADGSYTTCTDAAGNTWWCNATPVPGQPTDGSHWEQTVTNDGNYTVCMDTDGNWWWCDP